MARRDGCTGKVRHPSFGAAVAVLKKVNNAGLSAYRCGKCGSWHLGNTGGKWQKRLDQLLGIDRAQAHAHAKRA